MKKMLLVIIGLMMVSISWGAEWQIPTIVPTANTVDSTKIKNGSASVSDIANGKNGFVNKSIPIMLAFTSSVVPDTVNASTDSLNCVMVANFANPSEYIAWNHAYGNDSPARDRGIFMLPYKPVQTELDSAYIWLRGSISAKPDSLLCHLRIIRRLTATDSTVIADSLFVPSTANTWQRKAVALTAAFTLTSIHQVMIEVYASNKNWMDVSPLYLK